MSARRQCVQTYTRAAVAGTSNVVLPVIHDLGAMTMECSIQHCRAVHFRAEKGKMLHSCCHNGKICQPNPERYPPELEALLMGNDVKSRNFREFIRQYNSANAFASFGANIADIPGNGPYCFKVSGEVYHHATTALRSVAESSQNQPKYAQLYIYDADEAVQIRMKNAANVHCSMEIMSTIDEVIRRVSPYAQQYKRLGEVVREEERRVTLNSGPTRDIRLLFTRWRSDDQRRYNAPSGGDEVAMIFVADQDGNVPDNIDIAVYPCHERTFRRINRLSRHLDPMVFVLLFPLGEPGWTLGMQHHSEFATRQRTTVTQSQFYAHKIAVRRGVFNSLHYAGKLFQQFIVHAYVMTESERLAYIKNNQKDMRVECYKGLLDHVNNMAVEANARVGNVYILPSTFTGGQRHMAKLYQDSMAMVRKYGRPDLFITFTCNPKWPEILNELSPWQSASDRPDLVARVFQLKVEEFLRDMVERHVFGNVIAWVYVIEEQKRGLPHLHGLFTLSHQHKFPTSTDIDKVVSAEIPDPNANPELYQIIMKHNIHGPCGHLNSRCVCMVDGQCSKKFPKPFRDETDAGIDGYPQYKRPDNTHSNLTVRGLHVDNGFVVPYNAYLSQKFNAHINVEICSSVLSIKYIHKYISKGHDCARLEIRQSATTTENEGRTIVHDEISQFVNCRYVSPPEAAWRLLENPIHGQSHVIIMLAVHLPEGQSIVFVEGQEEEALRRAAIRNTTLTAWFELNREHPEAHAIRYQDLPNHYTFSGGKWKPRQRGGDKVIGRISAVSPRNVELYHLRLLLLHVTGVASFQHLRTVNDIVLPTFREAARTLGLIEDDGEWTRCMNEGASYMMPRALRTLFELILIHCHPCSPLDLWNTFKTHMSEDFIHEGVNEETAESLALMEVQQLLLSDNSSCREHGLPQPLNLNHISSANTFDPVYECGLGEQMLQLLNEQQTEAAKCILNSALPENLNSAMHKCFFIDGPGGTGKTFLYTTLIHVLRGRGQNVLSVAWTGIAAILLPGGITCHTAFNLPLDLLKYKTCRLSSKNKSILHSADVIIWDEAPMAPADALAMIDRALRDLMVDERPFGGKVVILGGDFRQVLPVIRRASRGQIVAMCIKSSPLWQHFKIFNLRLNMRANGSEVHFAKWLLDMGDGNLPHITNSLSDISISLPSECISQNLVTSVFGEKHNAHDAEELSKRAILCPKNEHSRLVNAHVLANLEGEMRTYLSIDTVKTDHGDDDFDQQVNFPVEFLNSLNPPGLPLHALTLKIGAIVMLLRNLSIGKGLCNGSRMIVRGFNDNVVKVEVITGAQHGSIHLLPRVTLDTASDVSIPFNLCRRQFPIKLAYALTINKAQGQTFDRVGILLPEPVFTHGQLYVACSRVRSKDCLKVHVIDGAKQGQFGMHVITDNVVYEEVLT